MDDARPQRVCICRRRVELPTERALLINSLYHHYYHNANSLRDQRCWRDAIGKSR